jgi:hypothetical protein
LEAGRTAIDFKECGIRKSIAMLGFVLEALMGTLKDVVKLHLYKTYSWKSIGVAQYMTGDVAGLGIAAAGAVASPAGTR